MLQKNAVASKSELGMSLDSGDGVSILASSLVDAADSAENSAKTQDPGCRNRTAVLAREARQQAKRNGRLAKFGAVVDTVRQLRANVSSTTGPQKAKVQAALKKKIKKLQRVANRAPDIMSEIRDRIHDSEKLSDLISPVLEGSGAPSSAEDQQAGSTIDDDSDDEEDEALDVDIDDLAGDDDTASDADVDDLDEDGATAPWLRTILTIIDEDSVDDDDAEVAAASLLHIAAPSGDQPQGEQIKKAIATAKAKGKGKGKGEGDIAAPSGNLPQGEQIKKAIATAKAKGKGKGKGKGKEGRAMRQAAQRKKRADMVVKIQAVVANITQLKAKVAVAAGDAKKPLQAKLAILVAKLRSRAARITARVARMQATLQAMESMHNKIQSVLAGEDDDAASPSATDEDDAASPLSGTAVDDAASPFAPHRRA